ncbi:MAG: hypothetical protein JSU05_03970 [Bacteroidetes bacterium]|nr:hypothetical protein [Bacteroidota bacterium]
MQLVEVVNQQTEKEFLKVNVLVNSNDPNYIRPLDKDITDVFNPKKNKAYRFGETKRWILEDSSGKLIGRIAAFTNKKYKNKGDNGHIGGIGFFDCVNNQEAADMLFDVAKHWLLQRGMEAMDGPINFGERDRWWGLLVEGFQPPVYCLNYNQPYYKSLFETYGFKPFYNQICFGFDPAKPLSEKIIQRHNQVASDPGFSARHINKSQLEKYATDFTIVYNKAWAGHGGLKEIRKEQVLTMFQKMKMVMDEKIIWYVYYNNDPIAIFVNIPDLNQWFKYLNGKFGLIQKLRFLWIKRTKINTKFTGLVFGIVPEFQGRGIDSYMIREAGKVVQNPPLYKEYEMQWIGDFNPKMINVAENFGDTFRTRKLTTYRYLFDRTREFKAHPLLS